MFGRLRAIIRSNFGALGRRARSELSRASRVFERFDGPVRREERRTEGGAGDPGGAAARPATTVEVRRAFAALEIPITAGTDEIRHAYRRLMSRYHPDRHATDPGKEAVANELSGRLTEAYDLALEYARGRAGPSSPPTTGRQGPGRR